MDRAMKGETEMDDDNKRSEPKEMIDVISIDADGKETKERWDYRDVYLGDDRLYEAERLLRNITPTSNPAYLAQEVKKHLKKWKE